MPDTPQNQTELSSLVEKLTKERDAYVHDISESNRQRDEFHRCLLARENSLKEEGNQWVKAMTERDEARSQLHSEVES